MILVSYEAETCNQYVSPRRVVLKARFVTHLSCQYHKDSTGGGLGSLQSHLQSVPRPQIPQRMPLGQFQNAAPAIGDQLARDQEPASSNRGGLRPGLLFAQNVCREQDELIEGQKAQFQVCGIGLKLPGGNVPDPQIALGLTDVVFDVRPLVVEPIDVLFVPIQVGDEHRVGVSQDIEQIRRRIPGIWFMMEAI